MNLTLILSIHNMIKLIGERLNESDIDVKHTQYDKTYW